MILDIIKSPVQTKAEYLYFVLDKELIKIGKRTYNIYDIYSIINNCGDKDVYCHDPFIDFKFGSQWYQLYALKNTELKKIFKFISYG